MRNRKLGFALLASLLLATACNLDADLEVCPYNARLEYWYIADGNANILPNYIYSLHEYVFDQAGVLRQVNEQRGEKGVCAELNVPPGDYTLVAWGNRDSFSRVENAVVGKSLLSDLVLNPHHPVTRAPSLQQSNTDPLYYGHTTFTVKEQGVSRQRIDMVHAHLKLEVTVKWKGKAPTDAGNLSMTLEGVPGGYRFVPEYEVRGSSYGAAGTRSGIYYYIPSRLPETPLLNYSLPVRMDILQQVRGEFITHRLHNDSHPVLCLYAADRALIKEIDLYRYFRTMQIDLNTNLRQEFRLVVEVDEAGGVLVFSAVVSDWIDGGTIGGGF